MGRDNHNKKMHRNNNGQLPQTPAAEKRTGDDVELANELGDRYKLEVKPGFGPTGVERKES